VSWNTIWRLRPGDVDVKWGDEVVGRVESAEVDENGDLIISLTVNAETQRALEVGIKPGEVSLGWKPEPAKPQLSFIPFGARVRVKSDTGFQPGLRDGSSRYAGNSGTVTKIATDEGYDVWVRFETTSDGDRWTTREMQFARDELEVWVEFDDGHAGGFPHFCGGG
jgi:hypothetical protein